nr:MAG TPA: hypothetical protein [Bacteriophage sp.]
MSLSVHHQNFRTPFLHHFAIEIHRNTWIFVA